MKRFLIIDDQDAAHKLIGSSLKKMFPQCIINNVYNFEEAIESLEKEEYDLITLDGGLSEGHHGREILSVMNPDQIKKTVVYSGEISFLSECKGKNILAFIKGYNFDYILEKVKDII